MSPREWRDAVGVLIEGARGRESIRSAARRAGVDEAMWRQVELGYRRIAGTEVPANPRDRNLVAIARAVGLDPSEVFKAARRGQVHEAPFLDSGAPGQTDERLSALEVAMSEVRRDLAQIAHQLDRATDEP